MENFEQEIFRGKTFSDLIKEIYEKSNNRSKQIRMLIDELRPMVKTIGDATVIVPIIKDYLDVDVKNTDLLVKIAVVIQRHLQKSGPDASASYDITVDEINQLMESAKQDDKSVTELNKKVDSVKQSDKKKDDFEQLMGEK